MTALVDLQPTDGERERARDAILAALPRSVSWAVLELVRALRSISHLEQWLDWLTDENAVGQDSPDDRGS